MKNKQEFDENGEWKKGLKLREGVPVDVKILKRLHGYMDKTGITTYQGIVKQIMKVFFDI